MTIAAPVSAARSESEPDPTIYSACPPPHPRLQVSVVVPARNEAHHLIDTLDALRNQHTPDGSPLPAFQYEVLLLLNNCTDTSEQLARQYQRRYPAFPLHIEAIQLPASMANVGTARRLLMDEACRRLQRVKSMHGIIASTDGDTIVDSQWLYQIIEVIRDGNEAVGGRILTRPDRCSVRLNHLRDVTYRMLIAQVEAQLDPQPHDPWPRHFQHFGANMAVTCTAYLRAGGLPNVPHLEDEALYRALLRTDARIRKSPQVRVFTSTRLNGQATVGFSEQLRYWHRQNEQQQHQLAEPAAGIIHRLRYRHQLRTLWQTHYQNQPDALSLSQQLDQLAGALHLCTGWLHQLLGRCRYFGECWEQIEQKIGTRWTTAYPPVSIVQAITDLRQFLHQPTATLAQPG